LHNSHTVTGRGTNMPYKSDAQRKFFHTDTAKEAGITDKEVKEFDKTSKGKDLPEKMKMAEGGVTPDRDEPGVQDATASDFLLPFMLGPSAMEAGAEAPAAIEAMGEKGAMSLGKMAPNMEMGVDSAAPKVEAFVKGIQKSPNGNEVKLWGVRGDPNEIAKLGYGSDPASVPEHILRQKGLLPDVVDASGQDAPNNYAKGGLVDGGNFPHVTFMENGTPAEARKTVHMAPMADGGVAGD